MLIHYVENILNSLASVSLEQRSFTCQASLFGDDGSATRRSWTGEGVTAVSPKYFSQASHDRNSKKGFHASSGILVIFVCLLSSQVGRRRGTRRRDGNRGHVKCSASTGDSVSHMTFRERQT